LSEAVSAESKYAETAQLQEAKNILQDYISLLSDRTNKSTVSLLAK
jgi:hypothetical protein